jgi:photosystem II stability/assembly factor-like uncharacterized protein
MRVSYRRCRKLALRPVLASLLAFPFLILLLSCASNFAQENEKSKADESESAPSKVDRLRQNRAQNQNLKPIARDSKDLEELQEGADFLRRRQDYFFKPRAFPIGFIPQGARERALQQKIQMYQREGRLSPFAARPEGLGFLAPPTGTSSNWLNIGPQPTLSSSNPPFTSGRVTALAVNPNNANNVFLGGADGGLWMSTDGGTNWTPLTDNPTVATGGIPSVAVGAIALDPTTCGSGATGICTTVYVGTGEDNFGGDNIYGEGVLNCTITASPLGVSCTQDTTFHAATPLDDFRGGPMIGALAVNRANHSILLAGIRGRGSALPSGVYCSSNSGSTWTRVLPVALTNNAGTPGTDVAFASDGTAWAALSSAVATPGSGIYKSTAPITSCSPLPTFTQQNLSTIGFTSGSAGNIGRITLALAPNSDATIYAAIADATSTSSNLLGVVRSTNANTATPTWTKLTDPLVSADTASNTSFCSGQCFYDIALGVDPANASVLYAGGSGAHPIVRTTTGTSTTPVFADVTNGTVAGSAVPHVDTHAFAFAGDGSKIWVGNDGGVWASSTPSASLGWINLNGPSGTSNGALSLTQFYPGISIHPSNPGFAIGGSQDNGLQINQAYQPTPPAEALGWLDAKLGCDGGFTVIDPTVPTTSYGECEYLPSRILVIGVTFAGDGVIGNGFLAVNGIDDTDRGNFIPPLVVDASNSQTLYFGTCRVWQTKDGANTWTAISPDVTSSAHAAGCSTSGTATAVLNTIAVAPTDSNTIYVGSDQGEIEVTSNGGTSWTSLVTATLPTRTVNQIVVDPTTAAGAYAVFSGFGSCNNSAVVCDGKGHIFKLVSFSPATWTDNSGNLPDIPVNTLVIDPDDPTRNTLYIGTDIGAFFSIDGGTTWSPLGAANSMPNAQILSMVLHNPSRTLRAAAHGRGVWDLNLGPGASTAAFRISALSPLSVTAPNGGTGLTLSVTGTGFTGGTSMLLWNGSPRPTSVLSATSLTATISASDVAAGAVIPITVQDGANTTNSLPFVVLGSTPTLTSISPTSTPVQTPTPTTNLPLTATGSGFTSTSQLTFNGSTTGVTITSQTAAQIVATLDKSLLGPFGSTNDIQIANQPGNKFSAAATFIVAAPPPANDNFANAISITATTFTNTQDSSAATTQAADPVPPSSCVNQFSVAQGNTGGHLNGQYNTIWYKVVPSSTGTANIDTMGSSYDSVLSVWSGTSQTALTAVACNDDINPGIVTQSQLTNVTLSAGTTYYIMVSSFGPPDPNPVALGGKSVLNFSFTGGIGGTSPDFTMTPQAPSSVTVNSGSPATYTVAIAGTNGFTGNVAVSCSLSAAATTCAANPASVAAGSNTTITVTTTAHQMLPPSWPQRLRLWPRSLPVLFLTALLMMLLARMARTRRQRLAIAAPAAGVILFLLFQAVGCSGVHGGSNIHGTQAGTYTVTITGTGNGTTHTATVSLTVN